MSLSPILAYPLDDANLGVDSSGSGLDATVADVILVTDSERGNVASFANPTSKLVLSSASVPSSLVGRGARTYAFWINFSSTSTSMVLFNNGVNVREKRFRLQLQADSTLRVDVKDFYGNGSTGLSPGTWYHLACVFDGVFFTAYVDGTSDASLIAGPNMSVAEGDFIIGEDDSPDEGFFGLMSDFRVYDTALPVEEIVSLSTTTPDPPTSEEQVLTSGDLRVRSVSARNKYTVYKPDAGSPIKRTNHFAHVADSADASVTECSRIINGTSGDIGYFSVGVLDPVTGTMVQSFKSQPSSTVISTGETNATFTESGLSFDSDDCAIYFGKERTFRIMFTSNAPARLVFQCLDPSTGEYITKFSCEKE